MAHIVKGRLQAENSEEKQDIPALLTEVPEVRKRTVRESNGCEMLICEEMRNVIFTAPLLANVTRNEVTHSI
jgi:hypothetical protein